MFTPQGGCRNGRRLGRVQSVRREGRGEGKGSSCGSMNLTGSTSIRKSAQIVQFRQVIEPCKGTPLHAHLNTLLATPTKQRTKSTRDTLYNQDTHYLRLEHDRRLLVPGRSSLRGSRLEQVFGLWQRGHEVCPHGGEPRVLRGMARFWQRRAQTRMHRTARGFPRRKSHFSRATILPSPTRKQDQKGGSVCRCERIYRTRCDWHTIFTYSAE